MKFILAFESLFSFDRNCCTLGQVDTKERKKMGGKGEKRKLLKKSQVNVILESR